MENHEGNMYLWVWPVKLTVTLNIKEINIK
jgi:hypothetical protein